METATIVGLQNKFTEAAQTAWSWAVKRSNHSDGQWRSLGPFLVAALAAILVWSHLAKKTTKSRLPLPPGPRGVPFLGCIPYLEPDIHSWFARLAREYGPIISLRLGQKLFVVVSSPSLAKELLKDQDATFANRDAPPGSMALLSGVHGMGWAPYGARWRMLRRVCMGEMLNSSKLDISYDVRRSAVREMVAEVHGGTGAPINVGNVMFVVMYKVITGLLWGGSVAEEEKRKVGDEFQLVVEYLTGVFCKPDVSDFFPILAPFDLGGVFRQTKKGGVRLEQILDSLINQSQKRGNTEGTRDFLQILLEIQNSGDTRTPLTRSHIKSLLMELVLAGNDTTWTTMEWAMTEVMKHPEVMKNAQEELDKVVGRNHSVEEVHLPNLHYVNAFVKEVLRLHPVVPLMLPRTPSQSTPVGGYMVPKGSRVLVNMWSIQRNPAAWESPEEFRPERFLMGNGKREITGNDFHYFPFGSGRRICPGMALAERMLMYVMATLLHSFHWKLPEGTELDVSEKFGIVLKKAKPLMAVPSPRLSDLGLYSRN
ncbi:flavonoid 3'-monooxygenase CYP75B137-like [Aristolochia californica]|uniref:flavonoid 3'-monooxygenase CYP75B137-like n=1 Tax=Aristolochia californica TaxID=171875 RepID=UPI0035E31945